MENVFTKSIVVHSTPSYVSSIQPSEFQTLATNQQRIPIKKLFIIVPTYNEEKTAIGMGLTLSIA